LGLAQDHAGNLWVGTDFEGGMFRYEKGQFFHYWKNQGISLLADPAVRVIIEDGRTHRIWVGTDRALNVARRSFPFRRYTTKEGLGGNTVHAICEDDEGNVWIGTSGGLTEFQGDNLVNFTTHNGLSHNNITAICEDDEKNLWIGTGGGGLNRFHDGKFTSYTARQGLFSDEIFEVLEDDSDRIWMTCGSGIFWIARKELDELDAGKITSVNCVSYGTDDGLATATCNDVAKPCACKSRDGRLWFATVKGLSVVDPNLIPKTSGKAPAVFVENVLYDGKSFDAGEPLRLAAGRGDLDFQFTALSFTAPERNRFKYKLDGVDHEWVDAGTARSARYNNLAPGSYRFHVIACDSEGVWNEAGAIAAVALEPQFWQTWWFWLAVVVVAGLLAAAAYRAHVSRIRELERLRVRIAADLHDEIGSSLGSIALLTRKIEKEGILIADQKSDLASINRISTQSANSIRDIVWFINPDYDTMQDLLLRMRDAASTRLGGIDISFTWPEGKLSRGLALDFRRDIFLMFKEILGNIAKHSQASEVEIVITDRQGGWKLLVRDNGVGFDPASVRQGNGLGNLRKRAEKLNGALEIKSAPQRGTTVIFTLDRS
jgi:signal transduction histidine kinase